MSVVGELVDRSSGRCVCGETALSLQTVSHTVCDLLEDMTLVNLPALYYLLARRQLSLASQASVVVSLITCVANVKLFDRC